MPRRPVIHLTNWATRRLHKGRRWTIMARPRNWEMGLGSVPDLTPPFEAFELYKEGKMSIDAYREFTLRSWHKDLVYIQMQFGPDMLYAILYDRSVVELVKSGDTLLCCCAKRHAEHGRCHRVWAAELLRRAGWEAILDGAPLEGVDDDWRPIWRK